MPWTPSLLTGAFALTAAASWGSGDFTAGLATRRVGPFHTLLISYVVGLATLTVAALARFERLPPPPDLLWGALGGLSGVIGLGFLLRGFATGRMGVVAPVSAMLATIIPVVFAAFTEGLPRTTQLLGFGFALVSIWMLSRPDRLGGRPAGVGAGMLAGLGFAGFFIALDQVGEGAVFWPLVAGRLTTCALMIIFALAARRPLLPPVSPLGLLALAGILDVGGNLFFLLATQAGRLDVAAVLVSLYPAVTAILARLIAKEHLARLQVIGVGVAVLAIVFIST
jgi:drug/metabolite transporter (DMT)-like permease